MASAGTGGNPTSEPVKTLLDIMPSFTLHKTCQTCVKEECATAKNCKDGSSCFEHMECVIEYCKTSPPPISGAYVSDVSNCVKGVGYCSAAVSCLQDRCYFSCQE